MLSRIQKISLIGKQSGSPLRVVLSARQNISRPGLASGGKDRIENMYIGDSVIYSVNCTILSPPHAKYSWTFFSFFVQCIGISISVFVPLLSRTIAGLVG